MLIQKKAMKISAQLIIKLAIIAFSVALLAFQIAHALARQLGG